jgi:hypothetical protein
MSKRNTLPYRHVVSRRFGGTFRVRVAFTLQSYSAYSALNIKVMRISETSIDFKKLHGVSPGRQCSPKYRKPQLPAEVPFAGAFVFRVTEPLVSLWLYANRSTSVSRLLTFATEIL